VLTGGAARSVAGGDARGESLGWASGGDAGAGRDGPARGAARAGVRGWARGRWVLAMGRAGPERCAGEGGNGPQEREKETWAALGRAWGVGAGLGREERVGLGSGLLGFGSWVSFLFYSLFFSFSKSISNKV